MSVPYTVLGTGSKGNAVIIMKDVLIDCGLPWKKIEPYAWDINLVLLSHTHSDHFKPATVAALAKMRHTIRWGGCEWMVQPLLDAGVDKRQIDVYVPGGIHIYSYGSGDPKFRTWVEPFMLHHNVQNCGYKITVAKGSTASDYPERKILYATDTGYIDDVSAPGFDLYLIEANHTEDGIRERIRQKEAAGEYPYEKEAAKNHLSREQAEAWLVANAGPQSEYVFLHGHVD